MDRQDLLETPTYVRLKFFAEGRDGKAPPIKGSFRDVQIKSQSIEELSEVVVQWLGSPGAWQLATVANWPLTAEAMRRPTTERCPLVVHVWNSQEKLAEDVKNLKEFMATFGDEMEKRLKDMDAATDKKVKNVEDQVRQAEDYFNQTYLAGGNSVDVSHIKTQAGVRRQFFVMQAWMVILVNIFIALCIGSVSVIALEKAEQTEQFQRTFQHNYLMWKKKAQRLAKDISKYKDKEATLQGNDKTERKNENSLEQREHYLALNFTELRKDENSAEDEIKKQDGKVADLEERVMNLKSKAQGEHRQEMNFLKRIDRVDKKWNEFAGSLEKVKAEVKDLQSKYDNFTQGVQNLETEMSRANVFQANETIDAVKDLKMKVAKVEQKAKNFSGSMDKVTQKLKGMQNSISKFNATLLNSSTGASAAEKEQKKQENEVAEIQETLGNLKNKAQGEQRKDMKFSDRISQVEQNEKSFSGSMDKVTQKLKGMEDSISDLNATVIDSPEGGAKHRFLRQKLDRR